MVSVARPWYGHNTRGWDFAPPGEQVVVRVSIDEIYIGIFSYIWANMPIAYEYGNLKV